MKKIKGDMPGDVVEIGPDQKEKAENIFSKLFAELKENIEDGIEYDPEKDNKYLAEDEVVAEDDLKDGYVEAEEDDILLDDENDSENDELFENLDDEDDGCSGNCCGCSGCVDDTSDEDDDM